MLLPIDEIKKGILHPEALVRAQALYYFAEAWSTDATVMPFAVQALQKYGWKHAFRSPGMLGALPQTRETFLWFISELERAEADSDEWDYDPISSLSSVVASADVALLREYKEKALELAELDYDAQAQIEARLQYSLQDSTTCWQELEEVCEASREGDHEAVDIGTADLLADAIARDVHSADRVVSLLSMKVEARDHPMQWMQGFAVRIAGEMRLQAAVPALVQKFEVDELFGHDDAAVALAKIGGDATVEAICHDFANRPQHYRYNITNALEHIRSPLVATKCLELFDVETDEDVKQSLLLAALNNFSSEAIEPGRRLASGHGTDDLRRRLLGVAMLMDISFPELAEWKQDLEDEGRGRRKQLAAAQRSDPIQATPSADELPPPKPMRPLKAVPKVGRNDPCPCGSGKKYKKCCMGK